MGRGGRGEGGKRGGGDKERGGRGGREEPGREAILSSMQCVCNRGGEVGLQLVASATLALTLHLTSIAC